MLAPRRCARIRKMEDIRYWVALNRVPQLGTIRFRRLEAYFGGLDKAWEASPSELKAAGIEARPAREIVAARAASLPTPRSSDWSGREWRRSTGTTPTILRV